ncbi:MAG: hypothetical protein M0P71_18500 [Melioribacteraceae bacterium]|nr:hypothetical protein [Melioribacteraceae bacterium]
MILRQKIDFLIYKIAYNLIMYVCKHTPEWSYYLELHIRKYNKENPVSKELKNATELCFNEMTKKRNSK